MVVVRYPREARGKRVVEGLRVETGPERWARWAGMVTGGMSKAEVARAEGISRAAVTMGLRRLSEEWREANRSTK